MSEHASDLKGLMVMSSDEGARLGTVSEIFIDTQTKHLAGLTFRSRPLGGEVRYVPMLGIQLIGRDMVLISGESSTVSSLDAKSGSRHSLKELQGCSVVTSEGARLGTLVDLDFTRGEWVISDLILAEHRHISVRPQDLVLGDDIILLPAALASEVQSADVPKTGLLGRVFGAQAVQDARNIISRTLKRKDKTAKGSDPDSA